MMTRDEEKRWRSECAKADHRMAGQSQRRLRPKILKAVKSCYRRKKDRNECRRCKEPRASGLTPFCLRHLLGDKSFEAFMIGDLVGAMYPLGGRHPILRPHGLPNRLKAIRKIKLVLGCQITSSCSWL